MRLATIILSCLLAGCAALPASSPDDVTFVLVRHAEKLDGGSDPGLSEAGLARAERLAERLSGEPVVAVYATGYRRSQQTAAPTARRHDMAVTTYDPSTAPSALVNPLRQNHPGGTVLVVGHSNTIPALASALCRCAIAPIGDGDYGRIISIRIDPDGHATVDDRQEP